MYSGLAAYYYSIGDSTAFVSLFIILLVIFSLTILIDGYRYRISGGYLKRFEVDLSPFISYLRDALSEEGFTFSIGDGPLVDEIFILNAGIVVYMDEKVYLLLWEDELTVIAHVSPDYRENKRNINRIIQLIDRTARSYLDVSENL